MQGRTEDSTWLEVRCTDQQVFWVAASVVRMAGDMMTVPVEKRIPPPPPTPTPVPASTPTPTAQSTARTTTSSGCQASQAAYQFHNFLGGPMKGTFTRQGDEKKASLLMPPNTDQTLCSPSWPLDV